MTPWFLRLFFSFWLTIIVAIGLTHWALNWVDQQPKAQYQDPHQQKREYHQLLKSLRIAAQTDSDLEFRMRLQNLPDNIIWHYQNSQQASFYGQGRHAGRWHAERIEKQLVVALEQLNERRRIRHDYRRHWILATRLGPDINSARLGLAIPKPAPPWQQQLERSRSLQVLFALIATGLLCYWLSRRWTAPIRELRRATRQLAAGDWSHRLPTPKSNDEFARLTEDFNHMVDALQESRRGQQQLLRDVSHELRTPLARIQAALGLVQQQQSHSGNEDNKRALDGIEQECQRLDGMIDELLQEFRPVTLDDSIDLSVMLTTLVDNNQLELEAKGLSCDLATAPLPAPIQANAKLLYSALENVLRNAIRHSPEGASIEIDLEQENDNIIVSIRDRGAGVEEPELKRLFQPFYRADSHRDRRAGGYGLGLAIAQRASRAHRGQITASNANPGLCIRLSLPSQLLQTEAP